MGCASSSSAVSPSPPAASHTPAPASIQPIASSAASPAQPASSVSPQATGGAAPPSGPTSAASSSSPTLVAGSVRPQPTPSAPLTQVTPPHVSVKEAKPSPLASSALPPSTSTQNPDMSLYSPPPSADPAAAPASEAKVPGHHASPSYDGADAVAPVKYSYYAAAYDELDVAGSKPSRLPSVAGKYSALPSGPDSGYSGAGVNALSSRWPSARRYLQDSQNTSVALSQAASQMSPQDRERFLWNDQFQSILELPEETSEQSSFKYQQLAKLSMDFVETTKTYGKVIISEHFLPSHKKTIKPIDLGGVAGGRKYVVAGILFKLAEDSRPAGDSNFIYGGEHEADEFAAKGAGHDLKGAVSYLNYLQTLGGREKQMSMAVPRLPMQALVDYRGFRLTAMPLLPLDRILYGSSDGGRTVHNEDPGAMIQRAARFLHLAPHYVQGKLLWSAGDIELHSGKDNRMYLLDMSRSFPPESPHHTPHLPDDSRAVFYRLFRPEYLQIRKEKNFPPLSADALCGWSRGQADTSSHNTNAVAATVYLMDVVVPDFAKQIFYAYRRGNKSLLSELISTEPISEKVHRRGLNIRHIGLLRSHFLNFCSQEQIDPTNDKDSPATVLLVEIVARTLKNVLRSWLREAMRGFGQMTATLSEFHLKQLVVVFLNLISCENDNIPKPSPLVAAHAMNDPNCDTFWNDETLDGLEQRFGALSLTTKERSNLISAVRPWLLRIIRYTLSMVGMKLSDKCEKECESKENGAYKFTFTTADLLDSDVRVKHMSLIDYAQGKHLLNQALDYHEKHTTSTLTVAAASHSASSAALAALRLHGLSAVSFQSALRSDTLNFLATRELTITEANSAELKRAFNRADEIIIVQLRRALHVGVLTTQVALPLLLHLLRTWKMRVKDPSVFLSDLCGASSLAALLDVLLLAQQCLNAAENSKQASQPQPQPRDERSPASEEPAVVVASVPDADDTADLHLTELRLHEEEIRRYRNQHVVDVLDTLYTYLVSLPVPAVFASDAQRLQGRESKLAAIRDAFRQPRWLEVGDSIGLAPASVAAIECEPASAPSAAPPRAGPSAAPTPASTGSSFPARQPTTAEAFAASQADEMPVKAATTELSVYAVASAKVLTHKLRDTVVAMLNVAHGEQLTGHKAFSKRKECVGSAILEAAASKNLARLGVLKEISDLSDGERWVRDPLEKALIKGELAVIPALLTASGGPDTLTSDRQTTLFSFTPLCVACRCGHAGLAHLLISLGADPNLADVKGVTPLMHSIINGELECAKLLLHPKLPQFLSVEHTLSLLSSFDPTTLPPTTTLAVNAQDKVGQTALWKAGGRGKLEKLAPAQSAALVRMLLHAGANPNVAEVEGRTLLMITAQRGDVGLARLLLSYGADPNLTNPDEQTSLAVACIHGQLEVVQLLLEHKANPNKDDKTNTTPLMHATNVCRPDIVRALIRAGAKVNAVNSKKRTALHTAAFNANAEVVRAILEEGGAAVDVNLREKHGRTPLFQCVEDGGTADHGDQALCVKLLLEAGADPSIPSNKNVGALVKACKRGLAPIVKLLLEGKATTNVGQLRVPLLHGAFKAGSREVLKMLLECGVNPNELAREGKTVLMEAAEADQPDVVELLLKAGADANLQDAKGATALIMAATHGHDKVVKVMLEYRAAHMQQLTDDEKANPLKQPVDLNIRDSRFTSALSVACRFGHTNVVKQLIEAGCDVNLPDANGDSPLFYSLRHTEIGRLLLNAKGIQINARNQKQETALHRAGWKGYVQFVRMLIEHGADIEAESLPTVIDKAGATVKTTPLVMALLGNELQVMKCLVAAGAKYDKAALIALAPRAQLAGSTRNSTLDTEALVRYLHDLP